MQPPSEHPSSSSTTTAAAAPESHPLEENLIDTEPDPTAGNDCGGGEHVHDNSIEVAGEQGEQDTAPAVGTECRGEIELIGGIVGESCSDVEDKSGDSADDKGNVCSLEVTESIEKSEAEVVVHAEENAAPETIVKNSGDDEPKESPSETQLDTNVIEQSQANGGVVEDMADPKHVEEHVELAEEGNLLQLDETTSRREDDGIVRASFADFVDDAEEDSGREEDGEEDEGVLVMGNPDLQKIREEQVRKWLIFEQENPIGTSEGSLTESMEADSLAAGGSSTTLAAAGQLMLMNGTENADEVEGDAEGMPRRVRFLTDQEGNLLISVFMSNSTPPAIPPLSEEPSIVSNGGADDDGNSVHLAQQQSPSLVVSPPSLENSGVAEKDEEELVDSIEPSAPPMEEDAASEDEEEPPSIVLIEPLHMKEPPREKPPAPPTSSEDSANDSSDETLSVSSCNSMIEILPSEPARISITFDKPENKEPEEQRDIQQQEGKSIAEKTQVEEIERGAIVTPCFQLGVMGDQQQPSSTTLSPTRHDTTPKEDGERISAESPQPASLIIHELQEHDEGKAAQNMETGNNTPLVNKVPNIDENNNVVEDAVDSVLEEEEEDGDMLRENGSRDNQPAPTDPTIPLQFNPEIGEQVMPELRRSTSSSSGEVEEDHDRGNTAPVQVKKQPLEHHRLAPNASQEEHEAQMVSLCIQEEHISAVAVTIAKWESMSAKAQSTENLSNAGVVATSPVNVSSHAPVTKSASSPCPKTTSGGLLSPVPPPKPQNAGKPIQPVAPVQSKSPPPAHQQLPQVNRLVIHGSNSPVTNEPIVVTKAAGWSCWGNKVINKDACTLTGGVQPASSSPPEGANDEAIYAQPNPQAGSTMTSITNPSAILKSYPKPLSRGEIVNWLREGEIHRAGLLLNYAQSHHHAPLPGHHSNHIMSPLLVSWFFGLISRQQAERYLQGQPAGTFLVRISTRIWGYTLSYQASSGRTKHFLISAINPAVPATLTTGPVDTALPPQSSKQQRMSPFLPQGRYAFIGTNMTPYGTLVSLIRHHSHAPITKLGGEKLLFPCSGGPQIAGLEALFQKSAAAAVASSAHQSPNSNFMMSSA